LRIDTYGTNVQTHVTLIKEIKYYPLFKNNAGISEMSSIGTDNRRWLRRPSIKLRGNFGQ